MSKYEAPKRYSETEKDILVQKYFMSGCESGAELERERIIALLETEMCEAYGENCDDNPHCTARNRVIALIKGENK